MATNWRQIGEKWGPSTDKETVHQYMAAYQELLEHRDINSILEIGVWKNGASLKMWQELWPQAYIYGIDYDEDAWKGSNDYPNIFIEIGDATDPNFVFEIIDKYAPWDLVIDDGSHLYEDVEASFHLLYDYVNQLYIIEDLFEPADFVQDLIKDYGGYFKRTPKPKEGLVVIEHD